MQPVHSKERDKSRLSEARKGSIETDPPAAVETRKPTAQERRASREAAEEAGRDAAEAAALRLRVETLERTGAEFLRVAHASSIHEFSAERREFARALSAATPGAGSAPRCTHGNALRDADGAALRPSCGCTPLAVPGTFHATPGAGPGEVCTAPAACCLHRDSPPPHEDPPAAGAPCETCEHVHKTRDECLTSTIGGPCPCIPGACRSGRPR